MGEVNQRSSNRYRSKGQMDKGMDSSPKQGNDNRWFPIETSQRAKRNKMKFQTGDLVWAWWITSSIADSGMAIVIEEENHEAYVKIWVPKINDSVLAHKNAITIPKSVRERLKTRDSGIK